MWIRNLELALEPDEAITWIDGLDIPGLEHIPAQEPLDFILHLQAYRLGHRLFGWSAAFTYEWISCAAGGLYFLVLWRIACHLFERTDARLTCLALTLSLGSLQLFFGYGESYTLVALTAAAYLWAGLRALHGRSLIPATLLLILAVPLHLMAVSLVPSWLYLLWHRRDLSLPAAFRLPRVYLLLTATFLSLGYLLYQRYFPHRMPLFIPPEEGMYALFSANHLATVANAVLLVSPFGLVWGLLSLRRSRPPDPRRTFLGWSALAAGGLIFATNTDLAGRDWDLMAFPGLFYTLWGYLAFTQTSDADGRIRRIRLGVVPLVLLHTILWIGVNATPERALERLGNLLRNTGQARHYRAYSLGHYYLNILESDYEKAADYLREAVEQTPASDHDRLARYRKNLGKALVLSGHYAEAVETFEQAYSRQTDPFQYDVDRGFQLRWATAYYDLGVEQIHVREDSAAAPFLLAALDKCRQIERVAPSPFASELKGRALEELNRLPEAAAAYLRGIDLQREPVHLAELYTDLGIVREKQGDYIRAAAAYERAVALNPADLELHYLLGIFYLDQGDLRSARRVESALRPIDPQRARLLADRITAATR